MTHRSRLRACGSGVSNEIDVEEFLRRLHERQARIGEIPSVRSRKRGSATLVGVENRDELTVRLGERVVEIAGLRVGMFGGGPA